MNQLTEHPATSGAFRLPIPVQKHAKLSERIDSSKQQHDVRKEVSIGQHYVHEPLEERQAISSPLERGIALSRRDLDVSERREDVESFQVHSDQHHYRQHQGRKQQIPSPKRHQRVPTITHPYNAPAFPASHQVNQNADKSYRISSNYESTKPKNKTKSSKLRAKKVNVGNFEDDNQSQRHHQDNYSDDGSKKSKRSIFSRASRKLKKKMTKEGSNSDIPLVIEGRDDEGSQPIREARDPSPTIGTPSRYRNNIGMKETIGLPEGDWVYSGNSPNREDYQGLIQTFPSLGEFSSGSTISTVFTNQSEDAMLQAKSKSTMSPIMERQGNKMLEHLKEPTASILEQQHTTNNGTMETTLLHVGAQHGVQEEKKVHQQLESTLPSQRSRSTSTTSSSSKSTGTLYGAISTESKLHSEKTRSNAVLENEVVMLRNQLAQREKASDTKMKEYAIQLERDLAAYKDECTLYRDRLVMKERENVKMEKVLYNERKKVLSLEAENEVLVNAAEQRVGNVITLEKAKSSELKSYVDQCEKYRGRILELESKVMSMESALNATTSIAKTLEEEKKAISSELSQANSNAAAFESETSQKVNEIGALRSVISSLESKCAKLEETLTDSKRKANDDNQSIVVLENENASLLEQLNEKTAIVEKLEASADHYKQLGNENAVLKRKVDELAAKEMQMKEELSTSEVFSSNTERLRKMLSDSESFISSLQADLSSARSNHHQQLIDVRAKHSSDIDDMNSKLESEQAARQAFEDKNTELEGKVSSLEKSMSEKEDEYTYKAKAQSDQMFELMKHADTLRKKLSESGHEMSAMKRIIEANESKIEDLVNSIEKMEEEKTAMSHDSQVLQGKLNDVMSNKAEEINELQRSIEERDKAVADLESITSSMKDENMQKIQELSNINEALKEKLIIAEEEISVHKNQLLVSKELAQKQAWDLKQHLSNVIRGLKQEHSSLKSDVESSLLQEKLSLEKSVKNLAFNCRSKIERDQLNKEMIHQASMSSLHSQMKDLTKLLDDERKKTQELQSTFGEVTQKREALEAIIKDACSKLGGAIRESDLIDAIDDLTLERAQADSTIITLNMDVKTLKSTIESLEYEKEAMYGRKKKEINDLKEMFNSEKKAQDAHIASRDEELRSEREKSNALEEHVDQLSGENMKLKGHCERDERELNRCREELTAAKEESRSVRDKLSEVTREYQDKSSELTTHYMKIEDELRIQLNSVRLEKEKAEQKIADTHMQLNTVREEKDSIESKLATERKETHRLNDECQTMKQQLTSRIEDLTEQLDAVLKRNDSLKYQEEALKTTIAAKERESNELQQSVDMMKDQLQSAQDENRKCEEIAEKEEQHIVALQQANEELEHLKRVCDLQRDANKKALADQQSSYESELEKMLLALEKSKENVESLTFENSSLEDSVVSLSSRVQKMERTKAKQTEQIIQLKKSLNEALEEALRLGSKIDAEEVRNLEIAQTLSLFQEENTDLKLSLTGIEKDNSSFNQRLGKIQIEKSNAEQQLFEALKSLTHFELKLIKAEQERDRQERLSVTSQDEVERLRKVSASLEREKTELSEQVLILQQDSKVDSLYKDLLEKMKIKDIQHEEVYYEMSARVESLKGKLASVTQEKNNLEAVNNEKINTLQSSLESIKQQLLKKQRWSDDASSTSSKTSKSHLKQTVVELEDSVNTIKSHYDKKVRSLQDALDNARKKIERYERKINDLTTLLEENASVVDLLHKKLKMKSNDKLKSLRKMPPVRSWASEDTEESEVSS